MLGDLQFQRTIILGLASVVMSPGGCSRQPMSFDSSSIELSNMTQEYVNL